MCGIAGILNLGEGEPPELERGSRMLATLRHRGPDEFGLYAGSSALLASARLSIIDLQSGRQPISNEDGSVWVVFNGEIFNYRELRAELSARGHRFTTRTDTEVLVHLYEDHGPSFLSRLNGQFAFAIWDSRRRELLLARDRLGVRPLFYTMHQGRLYFGSEIKAILANREIAAEIDPVAIDEIFHYWSCLTPRTAFRGILELPPGHFAVAREGSIEVQRYWDLAFAPGRAGRSREEAVEELRACLTDAVKIRLEADVEVGAYLSGGLDSSLVTALVKRMAGRRLRTFSISFGDPEFDESAYQREMAEYLGTEHRVVQASHGDIGRAFPEVIWHTECPILRTAPVPMFLLSRLVNESGIKAVLTGEGADEFLGGYDIFKEAAVRHFWSRHPESRLRPLLFERLYPDIGRLHGASNAMLGAFFRHDLTTAASSPYFSHVIRWRNGERSARFYSADLKASLPAVRRLPVLPANFMEWGTLERAQYLESTVFLPQYLLCSQGDRMGMANSVEGRFPFLDPRVVEFSCGLPSEWKLNGLKEKWLLRLLARDYLPSSISARRKRPYRAPIHLSFFDPSPEYVPELLSERSIRSAGLFEPAAVRQLVQKAESGKALGETDEMALAGILSTQLVHRLFVAAPRTAPALTLNDRVHIRRGGRYDYRIGKRVHAECVGS